MVDQVKDVKDQTVETVEKPAHAWQRAIARAGAFVGKPWRRYRAIVFQSYLIAAVSVFAVLALLAKTVAYFTFDVTITHAIQAFHPGWFDYAMRFLTWIGFPPQAYLITALIVVFLWFSGLRWEAVVSVVSIIFISVIGTGIKILVDRPRPSANLVHVFNQLHDYSFPSGHVLFYTAFFGFLLFLAFTLLRHNWLRVAVMVVLILMIVGIGPSRIYEGEHWASDVVAAYLLGSLWLTLSVVVYRWGKTRYFVDQPNAAETPAGDEGAVPQGH